jgi:hypothetical protein
MADLFHLPCAEKTRLLAEYNRAVSEWSETVNGLRDQVAWDSFSVLLRKVDEARAKTQRAKSAYNMHVAEHGCVADDH